MMMRVTVPGNIITVSFQPVSFGSAGVDGSGEVHPALGVAETAHLEWLPVDDLYVHQVEVHGVNVGRRIEYLPDLSCPGPNDFGCCTLVGTTETCTGRARQYRRAEHLEKSAENVERLVEGELTNGYTRRRRTGAEGHERRIDACRQIGGFMISSGRSAAGVTVVPTLNRMSTRELGPNPAGVRALTGLPLVLLVALKPGK